jgi:broad specificity phosphatase PhoE
MSTTPTPKTIYLIRHAQSEENRRLESLQSVARSLTRFAWPRSSDIGASLELLSLSQQVDSPVSEFGKQQIAHMADILRQDNFMASRQIQVVAHSPLIRARETCLGMLGCSKATVTSPTETTVGSGKSSVPEDQIYELDLLREKTPSEWIPGNAGGMYQRIRSLEEWLSGRSEQVICLVGHSQFFKAMLNHDSKFGNCDVMQAQFQPLDESTNDDKSSSSSQAKTSANERKSPWSNVTPVHLCRIQPTAEAIES